MISLHRALAAAGLAALGVVAVRALRRVAVSGDSMAPALLEGDRLLVFRYRKVSAGDVVALRDPRDPGRALVKRVAATPGSAVTCGGEVLRAGDGYVVLGDNLAASSDSRVFGPVPRSALMGAAVWRYAPDERRGRLAAR